MMHTHNLSDEKTNMHALSHHYRAGLFCTGEIACTSHFPVHLLHHDGSDDGKEHLYAPCLATFV
jgi:hypothetical protein